MNILIVEDEILIALELEASLSHVGHKVIGIASNAHDAAILSAAHHIDIALIDLNLTDGATGPAIACDVMRAHGAEVIFVTANPEQLPHDLHGTFGVVRKPYGYDCFVEVISFILAIKHTFAPPPLHLTLSPRMGNVLMRWPAGAQA
jgi:DNA-binding response OmpR family regulator